jgi:hypothetical protein
MINAGGCLNFAAIIRAFFLFFAGTLAHISSFTAAGFI